ncbi:ATP-binding protein [Corynebacterium sp.]|uniref:ATP-binding protein n=1 Tax=Corynebacterium sp. TaxID=1720 RepID=UPI0028ACD92D|nr:ATP-binding protein [Corynebacterium sp.]
MMAQSLQEMVDELRILGTDKQNVEVKSGVGKSIRPTLSAFSNEGGGLIIVGLSEADGFQPVPDFDHKATQDEVISRCAQMTPVVRPNIEVQFLDNAPVLVIEVPEIEARDKPCFITDSGKYNGSFRRTGDGDLQLTQYEVDRLVEEQRQPQWDDEAVAQSTIEDLDPEILKPFLEEEKGRRPKTFRNGDDQALRHLRILSSRSPQATSEAPLKEVTLAALLAMGEYPQSFFPRLTVTFAVFPGTDKGSVTEGVRLIDSATLSGPIPELVEETITYVKKKMQTGAFIGDTYRKDLPDYPLIAVREAIVNALMHRDYSPTAKGTPVQVNLFVDRLEITSPGGLYGTATKANLEDAQITSTRNQRLATFLESTSFPHGGAVAENRGTGIAVIQSALANALMPRAEIQASITHFTIIFRRRKVAPLERHGTAIDQVLAQLQQHETASTTELVASTKLSRSAITKALNELVASGQVEHTEPLRSPKQRYRMANS